MIITKKEIYLVTIPNRDEDFRQYYMDNREYARINGVWHVNTGGGVLSWAKADSDESELLEAGFQSTLRQDKLDSLV